MLLAVRVQARQGVSKCQGWSNGIAPCRQDASTGRFRELPDHGVRNAKKSLPFFAILLVLLPTQLLEGLVDRVRVAVDCLAHAVVLEPTEKVTDAAIVLA